MSKIKRRLPFHVQTNLSVCHKKEVHNKQNRTFSSNSLHAVHTSSYQHTCLLGMAEKIRDLSHHYSLKSSKFNKKIILRKIKKNRRKIRRKKVTSGLYSALFYIHALALNTVNSLHLRHITKYKATINSNAFFGVFKLLRGISVVTQAISVFGQTVTVIKGIGHDITMRLKRRKVQEMSLQYDPETKSIKGMQHNQKALTKLKRLVRQNQINLFRTKKQVIADKLLAIKNIIVDVASFTEATMLFIYRFTPVFGSILPGVSIVTSSLFFIRSLFHTGVQVSALNNLAHASSAISDPLLQALSGHIKQQRTLKARQEMIQTAVNAVNVGTNVSFVLTGELNSVIVSIGLSVTTMLAINAYNAWQERQNKKKYKAFERLSAAAKLDLSLATKNINVAETIFLHRLRKGSGETLKESIKFLRNLGVSESSIKQLQFASEPNAVQMLKKLLYKDKLQYKGLQLWQTGKTLLHVSGVSAAGKRIKNGSRWLAHRIQSVSHKLAIANTLSLAAEKTVIAIRKVDIKPSLLSRFIQHQHGYDLLVNEE